jgi:hypothetical protein
LPSAASRAECGDGFGVGCQSVIQRVLDEPHHAAFYCEWKHLVLQVPVVARHGIRILALERDRVQIAEEPAPGPMAVLQPHRDGVALPVHRAGEQVEELNVTDAAEIIGLFLLHGYHMAGGARGGCSRRSMQCAMRVFAVIACAGNLDVETLKQELSYTTADPMWEAVKMVAEAVGCQHPFLMISMLQSLRVCQAVADVLHELAPGLRPVAADSLHKEAAEKIEHFWTVSFFSRLSQVAKLSNAARTRAAASGATPESLPEFPTQTFGDIRKPVFLAQDLQYYNAYADCIGRANTTAVCVCVCVSMSKREERV